MTHQAYGMEVIQPCHAPTRAFFARFGCLGTCVLPAEVLDDTPLIDPETGLTQPSLRQCCSQDGQLCYVRVLYVFVEGLYWAHVAATPDLVHVERVVLTETHLTYALAWDERLYWRTPAQIRHLMQAQAEELEPLHALPELEHTAALFPAPVVPLAIVTTVEVTPDELRAAFDHQEAPHTSDSPTQAGHRRPRASAVQQGLLCALERALQELLETATDAYTASVLDALTALVARVERWHQQTRQRVVNAVLQRDARNGPSWALTLGVPPALLGTA